MQLFVGINIRFRFKNLGFRLVGIVAKDIAIGASGQRFDSRACQIVHSVANVLSRCDVSSELCYLGAKPWRWSGLMVSRFGLIPRLQWRFFFDLKVEYSCCKRFVIGFDIALEAPQDLPRVQENFMKEETVQSTLLVHQTWVWVANKLIAAGEFVLSIC